MNLLKKPSLPDVETSLSCRVQFVPLLPFPGHLLLLSNLSLPNFTALHWGSKPQCPDIFFLVIPLFCREISHSFPGSLSAQTASALSPAPPLPVSCAKSTHAGCRRYSSIALASFSPAAKIKFAGSGTAQILPLAWPLGALSQLRVSHHSRTLNWGLLVVPQDDQLNRSKLSEQMGRPNAQL